MVQEDGLPLSLIGDRKPPNPDTVCHTQWCSTTSFGKHYNSRPLITSSAQLRQHATPAVS